VTAHEYPPEVLERIAALAEADPEREVCGFVVRPRPGAALEVVAVRNAIGEAEGPPGLPGSARSAYLADPVAQLRLFRRLREEGGEVVACYHSHPEGMASLSRLDLELAVVEGRPVVPGAELVVVAMAAGRARDIARFLWNGRHFEAIPLGRPPRGSPAVRALREK
jgi:proteasome lid subunit RPN8/RPN11